jgi:zinc/manganese transport system substrate-binding protein
VRAARIVVEIALLALALALSACGGGVHSAGLQVVAAESSWGSIASQLAGTHASVRSIIVNPAQDPHSYEPTAADARALASSKLVIENGLGYDPWLPRLLGANPLAARRVLNVGSLLALPSDANPHRWYDPADVEAVATAITASLIRLDPANASYYRRRRAAFERSGLASYRRLIADIRRRYGGEPVGASESVFAPLAPALGLRLITPPGLMKATSEGVDVTAHDTLAAQRQISSREIRVWIYNSQNVAPVVSQLDALARAYGVPVTTVTETLSPRDASFESWQVAQLRALARALHETTGR